MPRTAKFSEVEILADVVAADEGDFSPEVAQAILRWRFSERALTRINRLAARNQKGTMTPSEREQLDRFLRVGSLINLLQAKARLSLTKRSGPAA